MFRAAVTLVVLLPGVGFGDDPPPAFVSPKGGYSVRFPGKPREQSSKTPTDFGRLTVTTATYAKENGSVWLVSYTDYPANRMAGVKEADFLAAARDGLKGPDGKVVEERKPRVFEAAGVPALEVTIARGKTHSRTRLVLKDRRLYQVQVFGETDFVSGPAADAFLESFRIEKPK